MITIPGLEEVGQMSLWRPPAMSRRTLRMKRRGAVVFALLAVLALSITCWAHSEPDVTCLYDEDGNVVCEFIW
jgi:hypothetical protein